MDTFESSLRGAPGNVPQEVRNLGADWWAAARKARDGFAMPIFSRLQVTEARVVDNADIQGRKEGRLVLEIEVARDMCNPHGVMHGGCASTLIDFCTSFVRSFVQTEGKLVVKVVPVSLALNVTFHSPAVRGAKLRIICSTVAVGARIITTKSEIYDVTNGRIIASGVHLKAVPTQQKL